MDGGTDEDRMAAAGSGTGVECFRAKSPSTAHLLFLPPPQLKSGFSLHSNALKQRASGVPFQSPDLLLSLFT